MVLNKVISGVSLLDLTLPSNMLRKINHAECALLDFSNVIHFANEAAKINDPKERIRLITAGFVGGISTVSRTLQGSPPIQSRLGETYQAVFSDGSRGYVEQGGTQRTETLVLIYGKDECFKLATHYKVIKNVNL